MCSALRRRRLVGLGTQFLAPLAVLSAASVSLSASSFSFAEFIISHRLLVIGFGLPTSHGPIVWCFNDHTNKLLTFDTLCSRK